MSTETANQTPTTLAAAFLDASLLRTSHCGLCLADERSGSFAPNQVKKAMQCSDVGFSGGNEKMAWMTYGSNKSI